jgi:hypothetical protein
LSWNQLHVLRNTGGLSVLESVRRSVSRLCRQHGQVNQYGDGHNVKEHMQRIRTDAIALRQRGMRARLHRSVASGSLRIRAEEIRSPPGRERTVACKSVGDPQPPKQPARIASAKVKGSGSKSDRKWSEIDQRGDEKFAGRELHPDAFYVVECSKRNPIVERHEQHNKTLKREQSDHSNGMHKFPHYTALFFFLFCETR